MCDGMATRLDFATAYSNLSLRFSAHYCDSILCRFTFIRDMSQLALSVCRQCLLWRRCISFASRTSYDMMGDAFIHNGNIYNNICNNGIGLMSWLAHVWWDFLAVCYCFGLRLRLPQSVLGWFFGRATAAVSKSINAKRKWHTGKMDIIPLLFHFVPFFFFHNFTTTHAEFRLAPSESRDTCHLKFIFWRDLIPVTAQKTFSARSE